MPYPIYTEVLDPKTGVLVCVQRQDSESKTWSIPIDDENTDYAAYLATLG